MIAFEATPFIKPPASPGVSDCIHGLVTDHLTMLALQAKEGQVEIGQTDELFIYTALVESENERTRGIIAPHAGFGHLTVRAQSQAMTF